MEIFNFKIYGHTTKQEWAVYVIVARPNNNSKPTIFYVGKVGDNRDGCNPIISRIGNHFSHNKIHSQLRNKLDDTTAYNYEIFYSTFGQYITKRQQLDKNRINELERELNRQIQLNLLDRQDVKLLNPYKGKSVNKIKRQERNKLLTEDEKKK